MQDVGIDASQRKAAKVAGLVGLLTMVVVVIANFGVLERLIVRGNVAETARNIMANERMFRVAIACQLIYSTGLVVLLSALYVIFRPVSRGLALLAALLRLVYALTWLLMTLRLFEVLRFSSDAAYLRVFEAAQLHGLARLSLNAAFDGYYAGLLFYASASTVCGYLWLKSGYIPKALAGFGVIASAFCVACTMAFIIEPDFSKIVNLWWFDSPMAVFEMATSVWLLVKGLRPRMA